MNIEWPKIRRRIRRGEERFVVDTRGYNNELREFVTIGEAETHAEQLAIEREASGRVGALPPGVRIEAAMALKRLEPIGATLTDAVDFYLKHGKPVQDRKKVKEVIALFLADKKEANRKETYLGVQKFVLGSFAKKFGESMADEIHDSDVEVWMRSKDWTPRTRLNYVRDLSNLFGFAMRKGWTIRNPIESITRPAVNAVSPGVLTVEQAKALLRSAGDMRAVVAVGLFAGVRSSELAALQWSDIDLAERNIHIRPEVAKTREGRDVHIADNLFAWLAPLSGNGPLAPQKAFAYHLGTKAAAAGIDPWPKNAMRHSFASYHFAHFKDGALTATQLGHMGSTRTLFAKYQKRVKPSEAALWWQIMPEKTDATEPETICQP